MAVITGRNVLAVPGPDPSLPGGEMGLESLVRACQLPTARDGDAVGKIVVALLFFISDPIISGTQRRHKHPNYMALS